MSFASRAASPAELGLAGDPRRLGVAVLRIAISQGTRSRTIDASDKRLADGFHEVVLSIGATTRYLEYTDRRHVA